jgi:hypothetical protein
MLGLLTPAGLRARICRLEEINDGLATELSGLPLSGAALSPEERECYGRGLLDASAAVEQGRHTLIEALGRAGPAK